LFEKYNYKSKKTNFVLININLSNREILTHKDNYIRATDTRTAKSSHQGADGRIIFELIGGSQKNWGAKQILLSVCDGYFLKHPAKTYL